jgi:hypothetical protein
MGDSVPMYSATHRPSHAASRVAQLPSHGRGHLGMVSVQYSQIHSREGETKMKRLLVIPLSLGLLWTAACSPDDDPADPAQTDIDATTDVPPDALPDVPVDVGPDVVPVVLAVDYHFVIEGGTKGEGVDTATLYLEDEPLNYAGIPSLQVDIVATATGLTTGRPIELIVNGNKMGEIPAVVVDEVATINFTAVTMPPSGNEGYTVTVQSTTTEGTAVSSSKTVLVHTDDCPVFVSPTTEEGCLISDSDGGTPGLQVAVQVMHTGGQCDRGRLTYSVDGADPVVLSDVAFDGDGFANFVVPVSDIDGPFEGSLTLTAEAIHPSSPSLNGTLAGLVYAVDTLVPTVVITQPDPAVFDTINLTMDKDPSPDAIGIQFDIIGTVVGLNEADTNSLNLVIDGVPAGTATPQSGVFAFLDMTFTQNGPVTIAVTGTDSCSNAGQASVDMNVFSGLSQLSIDSPTTGSTLLSKDNGPTGSATVYGASFDLTASDLLAGNELLVECRALNGGNTYFKVGSMTMTAENIDGGDSYALPVLLDTDSVSNSVLCRARVEAENPNQSSDIALTIGLPAPSISLTSPSSGVKLNTLAITLVGEASNLEGETLDVTVTDGSGVLAECTFQDGTVAGGVYSFTSDLGTNCPQMVGGSYTITVGATDSYGNTTGDNGGDASVLAHFDVTAPTLQLVTPDLGAVLDPVNQPAGDADQDAAKPGYQTTFTAQMNGENDTDGAQICLSVAGADPSCQDVADASFSLTWSGVTLQPGVSAVVLTGQDAYGNAADPVNTTVELDYDAPIVKILSPATDLVTTADNLDFVVEVTDSDTQAPIGDATVALLRSGTDVGGVPTIDVALGTYTFTAIDIIPASQAVPFQATADYQGLQGASSERIITKKTTFPTIGLDNVANGKFFNLASSECAGTQADCILDVTATLTDAEPGSLAELSVTCDGEAAATNHQDTIGDLTATFDAVTLNHGGNCTLVASITDLAGQKVSGTDVVVSVDRVAPSAIITKPTGETLLSFDDVHGADGLQSAFQVSVSGLALNNTVSAHLDWTDTDGAAQQKAYQHVMTQDVADDDGLVVAFADEGFEGLITYPDGSLTITIGVTDSALNATTVFKSVLVQSNPPSVLIQLPFDLGDDACVEHSDCGPDAVCTNNLCWTALGALSASSITVYATGFITTTDNLRVCSDNAAMVAAPDAVSCATPGYVQGAMLSISEGGSLPISIASLPDGYHTLVAELQDQVGAPWTQSVNAEEGYNHKRRIFRDTVAPALVSLISSSDTVPPTGGVLSLAEVSAGGAVDGGGGYYLIDLESDSDGSYEVMVQDQVRGSGSVSAGVPAQTEVLLDEGGNEIYVKLSDLAGNLGVVPPSLLVVYYQPTVDTIAPDVYFQNPESATVLAGDNLNVTIHCSENGSSVTLYDLQSATPAVPIDTLPVTNEFAIFDHATYGILTDGQHELQAQITDPSGNGTSVQSGVIQVDSTAPIVAISGPTSGAEITDDASAGTPGFQVAVDFATLEDAATYEINVASGCDAAFAGCAGAVGVASGSITNTGGTEPTQNVTIPISEALSYKQITVEVSDVLGNVATDTVNVSFSIADCAVAITNLPNGDWFNAASCPGGSSCASAQTDLNVTFFGCGNVDSLQLSGITADSESHDLSNGSGVYTVTLVDGADLDLEVKAFVGAGETGSSGTQSRGVDLTLPDVAFVSTTVGTFQTPTEGDSAVYNASDDELVGNVGFQGYLALSITDANATDGSVTSLTSDSGAGAVALAFANATVLPEEYSQSSGTAKSFYVVYPEGVSTIVASATDAAGNSDTATFDVTIDTVAPNAILLTNTAANVIDSADVNPRLPSVALKFTAVGDDGNAGDATSYGIRYSRNPIADSDDWDAACDVSALAHTTPSPIPASPGDSETLTVAGPDPRDPLGLTNGQLCRFGVLDSGAYYFAVRAQDDAGNWSPFSVSSVGSTDEIVWAMDKIEVSADFQTATGVNPDKMTRNVTIVGDVDGDGDGDIVFGWKDRGFCLVRGGTALGSTYTIAGLTGASHECVVDADVGAGAAGGDDVGGFASALGDVNGDGIDDFAVTSKLGGLGVVSVYLGVQDTGPDLTAANVRITGLVGGTSTFYGAGAAGNFNGDVHSVTSNDLDDIIVGEESASRARVIAGNESWTSATSLTIDTENAADLDVHVLLNVTSDLVTLPKFGGKLGPAGDILPTPGGGTACDDLLIQQAAGSDTSIYVIPGRVVETMNQTVTVTTDLANPSSEDAILTALRQDFTSAGTITTYGPTFQGGHDLTGDGIPDVVVTHGATKISYIGLVDGAAGRSVFVFDGAAIAAAAGGELRVNAGETAAGDSYAGPGGFVLYEDPNNNYGGTRIIGDWDGWTSGGQPTPDLAVSQEGAKKLNVRMNQSLDSASIGLGSYPWIDQTFANPATPDSSNAFGRTVDGGADVTGDGLVDIIVGTGLQEIYIIR